MAKADYACCLSCDCKVIYAPDWEGQGYVYCEDCGEKRAAKLARVEALPKQWVTKYADSGEDVELSFALDAADDLEAALKDTP